MRNNKIPKNIINEIARIVEIRMRTNGASHDWEHICRVRNMAIKIAIYENADVHTVEIASLLHDIADWKFNDDISCREKVSMIFDLTEMPYLTQLREHVIEIVDNVSFKGAGVSTSIMSIEGMCVQDADRLDAIGAIGVARCFSYSGEVGRALYDLSEVPEIHDSFESYKQNKSSGLTHFHEKLYLLKDRMNTKAAKDIAEKRHSFMLSFEEQLRAEISGNR